MVHKGKEIKSKQARQEASIIASGESLALIARRHQVPVRLLIAENKLSYPYKVRAGKRLKLPAAKLYIVKAGDTLPIVAGQANVSRATLLANNPQLEPPYSLRTGEELALPLHSNMTETAPVKAAKLAPLKAEQPLQTIQFAWPVQGKIISRYGSRTHGVEHDGITIRVDKGTPVKAAEAGSVVFAGDKIKGYGNLVIIKHQGNWLTAYAHQDALLVQEGDAVSKGQVIGYAGKTGHVNETQLYFSMRQGKKPVNPLKMLAKH